VIGVAFAAMTLPLAMVQACDMIDNSWAVASRRADRAGQQLAQVIDIHKYEHIYKYI